MNVAYQILIGVALFVAIIFSALIYFTSKGDAMSGGSGVRTTFKGKAGFDDLMSKLTLYLGVTFMALMLIIDAISGHMFKK